MCDKRLRKWHTINMPRYHTIQKKGVANDEARYAPPYLFDAAKVQTILQTTKFCSKKRMCADKKKPPLVHTSGGLLALPTASKRLLHCQRIDCFTSSCSSIDSVRASVHIEQIDCDRHYQHSQNDVQNFAPQWNAFACKRIL